MRPCLVSLSDGRFGCQKKKKIYGFHFIDRSELCNFPNGFSCFGGFFFCTSHLYLSCTTELYMDYIVLCVSAPSIMHCIVDACQLL